MSISIFDKFISELRLSGIHLTASQIIQHQGRVHGLNLHGLDAEEFEKFAFESAYLNGIKRLHLPKFNINDYPPIFHLTSLSHLCMSSIHGGNLPPEFYKFTSMRCLNLAANSIEFIGNELPNLPS